LKSSKTPSSSDTPEVGEKRRGTLFVVATPIGNLEDITLRAIRILGEVDTIAAEDTRRTAQLLNRHGIPNRNRLVSYHEHNERERAPDLLRRLSEGGSLALVSDAGTPSISDPGYHLIALAAGAGVNIVPIPGVSAAVAALSASGLPTDAFVFVGFPARKKGKRSRQLAELSAETRTLVFYESPKRLLSLVEEAASVFGDRPAVLCRELTKIHEEFLRGSMSEIRDILRGRDEIKGECTFLVAGRAETEEPDRDTLQREIDTAVDTPGGKLTSLAREIASKFNIPRKRVYDEMIKLKNERLRPGPSERSHRKKGA
jgi:16S rRNA (cytidine1402-2'-O)-methyltransferase